MLRSLVGSEMCIRDSNNGIPDGCENCSNYIFDLANADITSDAAAQIGIETNGKVLVGNNIEYHAGSFVELVGGFEVELNATFHAYIEPCN